MKTVSIVDSDPVAASDLRNLIDASGRYKCISIFQDFSSAESHIPVHCPQIVVFEPWMGDRRGFECIRALRSKMAKVEVLVFTGLCDAGAVRDAVDAGVTGYLGKGAKPHRILEALDELSSGGSPLSAPAARVVVELFRGDMPAASAPSPLTPREAEVLNEIIKGRLLKEICATLRISQGTLNTHLRNLYRKLGVTSRTEIMTRHFFSGGRFIPTAAPETLPGTSRVTPTNGRFDQRHYESGYSW